MSSHKKHNLWRTTTKSDGRTSKFVYDGLHLSAYPSSSSEKDDAKGRNVGFDGINKWGSRMVCANDWGGKEDVIEIKRRTSLIIHGRIKRLRNEIIKCFAVWHGKELIYQDCICIDEFSCIHQNPSKSSRVVWETQLYSFHLFKVNIMCVQQIAKFISD